MIDEKKDPIGAPPLTLEKKVKEEPKSLPPPELKFEQDGQEDKTKKPLPPPEFKFEQGVEPIRIQGPFFLDKRTDPTVLVPGACKQLKNVFPDKGILEVRAGVHDTDYGVVTSAKVTDGLFRFIDKDGNKLFLAKAGSGIKYWNGSAWVGIPLPGASEVIGTDTLNYICIQDHTAADANKPITGASYAGVWVQSGSNGVAWVTASAYVGGLTNGTRGEFRQFKDRLYFSDGVHDVIEIICDYASPTWTITAQKAGVPSPDFKRDIDMCENDDDWTFVSPDPGSDSTHSLVTLDNNAVRKVENENSIRLSCKSRGLGEGIEDFNFIKKINPDGSAIDLSTFETGEAFEDFDYVSLRVFRWDKSLIDLLTIEFSSEIAFTNKFTAVIYGEMKVDEKKTSVGIDGTSITDTGQDWSKYETLSGRSKYKVYCTGGGSNAWGFLGEKTSATNCLIYTTPDLKTAGWNGTAGTPTDYVVETYGRGKFWGNTQNLVGMCAEWSNNPYDYQGFNVRLRKKWFSTTGTLAWSGVKYYRIVMRPNYYTKDALLTDPASCATVNIDDLKILKSPPVLVELKTWIAHFDPGEGWGNVDSMHASEGISSLKIKTGITANCTFASALDLTYFGSPDLKSEKDLETNAWTVMAIDAAGKSLDANANMLITLTDGHARTVACVYPCTFKTDVKNGFTDQFTTLYKYRVQFNIGTPITFDWSDVVSCSIQNNTGDGLWVDNFRMERYRKSKMIDSFEVSEKNIDTGTYKFDYPVVSDDGQTISYRNHEMSGEGDEGGGFEFPATDEDAPSNDVLMIKAGNNGSFTVTIRRTQHDLDLSKYETISGSDYVESEDSDELELWMKFKDVKKLEMLVLKLFYNKGSSTSPDIDGSNYWQYTLTKEYAREFFKKNAARPFKFKRGDLVFTGDTTYNDLSKIAGYSLTVVATKSDDGSACNIFFDNWLMRKPGNLTGQFYAKLQFEDNNGYRSASSEQSLVVNCDRSDVYVLGMAVPNDSWIARIAVKDLFIMGGGSTVYKLAGTYPPSLDDTKVNASDESLGAMIEEDYYPPPKAKVMALQDSQIFYGNVVCRDKISRPSRVYASRSYSPGQVKDIACTDVRPEDGGQVRSIVKYWDYDTCFKDKCTAILGQNDDDSMYYKIRNHELGIIAGRSVAVTNFGIIGLSHRGILLTDLSQYDTLSGEPVKPCFDGYSIATLSHAVGFSWYDFYFLFYGTTNTKGLGWYIPRKEKGWFELELLYNIMPFGPYAISVWTGENNEIYFGTSDGRVVRMFNGDWENVGGYKVEIPSTIELADMDFGIPERDKFATRVYALGKRLQ